MKQLIILTAIVLSIFSCNSSKNGYQIDVTINNVPDGRKVLLKMRSEGRVINLDSTLIKQGKFSFKGRIKEPLIFGIFIDSLKQGVFPFVNTNDHVSIIAYKDSLTKSKITGSKLHDLLSEMRHKRDLLTQKSKSYLPAFQKAYEAKDTVETKRINVEVKKIAIQMAKNDWNFVKSHPNSFVTPLIFNGLMSNPNYKDSIQIVFNTFSEKIKTSSLSKPIRTYISALEKQKSLSKGQ